MKYPVNKRFIIKDVEFVISQTMSMSSGTLYSLYCVTDQEQLCSRGKLDTIDRKIRERVTQ